jgi:homoserine dehydrogenase
MSTTNVAVIGVGLVGKEFLKQLAIVASRNASTGRIKLVYASNSKQSVQDATSESGIPLDAWERTLSSSTGPFLAPSDLKQLGDQVLGRKDSNQRERLIVVDNTSSDAIAGLYPTFLASGIHVITPNKKAFSSSLKLYEDIVSASQASGGGKFLNESTVGAGLPIIATLKDLVATGDEVGEPLAFHMTLYLIIIPGC